MVIDITKQLENKHKLESEYETLMLLSDLIKSGEVTELVGVVNFEGMWLLAEKTKIYLKSNSENL